MKNGDNDSTIHKLIMDGSLFKSIWLMLNQKYLQAWFHTATNKTLKEQKTLVLLYLLT
jgi:hypothetical protein